MTRYLFNAGCAAVLLLSSLTAGAQLVKIEQGTQVVNTGYCVLESMHLINNGNFTSAPWSYITFKGFGERFIQGSGSTQFYHMVLDKTAGNLLLQTNIKVSGNLLLEKGSIDLEFNSLQLVYPNGFLQNETDATRIFSSGNGFVFIEQPMNAPVNLDPGNLGLIISSTQNLGTTVVYRGHDPQSNAGGEQSIKRYYSVVPASNTNLNAYIKFYYLDAELNGIAEGSAALFEKQGAGAWTKLAIDGSNLQNNWREKTGMPSLHKYTLFPQQQAPLPLQLLAFDVRCKDGNALLQWITANEVATKQFVVEKSENGTTWASVQNVMAGGSTMQQTYSITITGSSASYYRLKMEDKDGKFTYSPVKKMNCDDKNIITVGPNPTIGPLNISFQLTRKDNGIIQLLDAKGSLLQSRSFNAAQGLGVETLNMSSYPSGTYFIKISSVNGLQETKQILKR